jgi:hypothetical protein
MACLYCAQPHCGETIYPYYGLAPHSHGDAWKTGKFVGSTAFEPKSKWPEHFIEDEEAAGCGVYKHCPVCGDDGRGEPMVLHPVEGAPLVEITEDDIPF